ncbi:hypothetical protein PN499_02715 [Kamptonema animale CS-326]|jgi:hypothetical protein|uniref:hypothetical protein n=1 Tax=Kamptonema animale TaxID=92934 RepID=UPI00232B0088|nr:hypothetical protein [Kamptonema animale]MDB9510120.1 hypothetical protein [Kamptonema animale CS-326]
MKLLFDENLSPNMNQSVQLSIFKKRCHEYHTCLIFATMGLENIADTFRQSIVEDEDPDLFLVSGNPNENKPHSQIKLKKALMYSQRDGRFSDTLSKSMIVAIYTEWDEVFRQRIAAELESEAKNVMCDLMGDLRFVRHWIVHNKSTVDKNHTKIKVLPWHLHQGQELKVSSQMFSDIINCVNFMSVKIRI